MNSFPRLLIPVFAFFAILAMTPNTPANTLATWTDSTGNHAWEIPANWDIGQVPSNNTYDVRLATTAPCNLTNQFQIGGLSLSTSTANLNLVPSSLLAIDASSGINNSGLIVVNPTAANLATTLRFDINAPINGSGNIQLNGINPGDATLSASGVAVTNNHTIHGRGDISFTANQAVLVNNGTITADGPNKNSLRMSLSNAVGNKNNGTIQTTSSGALVFEQGFLDQRGGGKIIVSPFSSVTLGANGHMPTIVGGILDGPLGPHGFSGGSFQANAVFLDGCTSLSATGILVPPGGLLAILQNGLINSGSVTLHSTGPPAVMRFDASAAITGTGAISLDGTNPGDAVILADGVTVTIGPSQLIVGGNGDISMAANNAVLINDGTIEKEFYDAGTIRMFLSNAGNQNNGIIRARSQGLESVVSLEQGTLDQSSGGTLSAREGGTLKIGGAQPVTIIGGFLETDDPAAPPESTIQGIAAVLAGDITNSGTFEIPANNFTVVTATKLTNNGTITLDASSSLLRFDASTSVTGPGAVILSNNAKLEINNNVANHVINGSSHTLKGNGTIQIDANSTLTNYGVIAPGLSAGTLNFSGDLQLGFPSNLSFEIGGTTQGTDFDLLHKLDNGTFTLNGRLTVRLINGFTPASTDTFTIISTQSMLAGAFTNVANGARLNTSDDTGSFVVNYSGNNVVLSNFGPPLAQSRLLNIATRLRVLTGDNALIGGFILTGSDAKKVLVRGIGPSLTNHGVPDALSDPTLELHDSSGAILAFNNDWKDSQQTEIQNSGLPPSNDQESAIVISLPANNSAYTAILRGNHDTTGVGLVEVYDLDQAANSKLANISARGLVGVNDNVMIGGVIVGPNSANAGTVAVRGLGPSLSNFGISNALPDPSLELHDDNGNLVAFNDNWKDSQAEQITAANLGPADDRDSAMIITVAAGTYTAVVRGTNNQTGIAVVEVYNLP
jgi:hypothetical protein